MTSNVVFYVNIVISVEESCDNAVALCITCVHVPRCEITYCRH